MKETSELEHKILEDASRRAANIKNDAKKAAQKNIEPAKTEAKKILEANEKALSDLRKNRINGEIPIFKKQLEFKLTSYVQQSVDHIIRETVEEVYNTSFLVLLKKAVIEARTALGEFSVVLSEDLLSEEVRAALKGIDYTTSNAEYYLVFVSKNEHLIVDYSFDVLVSDMKNRMYPQFMNKIFARLADEDN